MRSAFVFALLVSWPLSAPGQCGNGVCRHRWVFEPADPARAYLYLGDSQIGAYDYPEDYYRPFDGTSWGKPCRPPIDPPETWGSHVRKKYVFGVVDREIQDKEAYQINGRPASRAEVVKEIASAGLDDDSRKPWITVIGSPEEKARALEDLENDPEVGKVFRLKGYEPDHWALRCGFAAGGRPTIYVQDAGGKVLHRQDDYQGGMSALAEALRKTKQGYDPKKDPDLRKQTSGPNLPVDASYVAAGFIGILGGLLIHKVVRQTPRP
jgi:hypothetical protein